jgi:gliding motility-associated-like protein
LANLIVTVVNTSPSTFCDTVFVGQIKLLCLDTAELFGNYSYLQDFCPDARTGNAEIFLESLSGCVEYEGLVPGKDSVCVLICDESGFCDTLYFCLFVKPYFDPPGLGDDSVITIKNTPVIIDFLANDTIFGGIQDIFVLDPPISGRVILNFDHTFTYIPDDPYCARWDHFTYVACNPNGCDTATVSIYIECISLTIFSAVSPNNDGVNDVFYIAKIEEFPDNRLWVYNRWGNLVFETTSYKNSWPGNWGQDTDLPDGAYFFILEWTDNGATTVQRGYFEMVR